MPVHRPTMLAAFAALYLIWGSTYLALSFALRSLPPLFLVGTRCLAASVLLFALSKTDKAAVSSLRNWLWAAIAGSLFFVGCQGALAIAQERVPSGLAAVILATIPLWLSGLSMLMPSEQRTGLASRLLLLPGFAGVVLIALLQSEQPGTAHISDILLLLGSAFSWAVGTLVGNLKLKHIKPATLSAMELLGAGLVLMLVSASLGEFPKFNLSQIEPLAFAGWLYLVVAGSVVAFGAYNWLLMRVPAPLIATYTFVNPIVPLILGWAVLSERPEMWSLMGAFLILVSVAGAVAHRVKNARLSRENKVRTSDATVADS